MQFAFELLRDLTLEQVTFAAAKHSSGQNGNASRFCPNAADLRLALFGTPEQQACVAWSKVRAAMHSHGSSYSVRFDTPAAHFALEAVGGWTGLCWAEHDMEPQFRRAYVAAITTGIGWRDVPKHFAGTDEQRGYSSWTPEQIQTVRTRADNVPANAPVPLELATGD